MNRILTTCLAATALLALLFSPVSSWAEDKPAVAPAAAPPAAAAPAAATPPPPPAEPAKITKDEWEASQKATKALTDSMNSAAMNNGDNAWMLVSSLLVLLMTLPGLALFYGGLVRKKNVLGTMMQSLALAAVVSVIWCLFGYAAAFGPGAKSDVDLKDDKGKVVMEADGKTAKKEPAGSAKFFGGLSNYILLKDVVWTDPTDSKDEKGNAVHTPGSIPGPNGGYAASIPHGTFMLFQLMFAIITPALICGAFAERMKFSAMLGFTVGWFVIVYLPLAHMVWGENGFFNWGFGAMDNAAFDFAGGTVVHISSGFAALIAALFIGKRKGYPMEPTPPHSIVLSFIGASLLWVGWFGFNAGSALSAGGLATLAFANTHFATAAAAITWPLAEWVLRGKPTVLGAISGAVAGLVAITPACGFVTPGSALVIGAVAGVLCMCSSSYLKRALGYDDALDAFGVHGVGGTWGAIATGIFFNPDANPGLAALNKPLYDAIVNHSHGVLFPQIKAVVITIILTVIGASVVLAAIKFTIGLRPSADDEETGLDLSQHGEEGYHGLA